MADVDRGELPLVVVITTGGTIAQRRDPESGIAFPAVPGAMLLEALPKLQARARIKIIDLCNMDSSWITPADWLKLGRLAGDELREAAVGLVITHGTDTMAETAFFLDLVLDGVKPVVLTGAMRLDAEDMADGPANLANAVAQVGAPSARDWGVTINMDGCIHAARHVRKADSTRLQSFTSGSAGIMGRVQDRLLQRIGHRPRRLRFPLPEALPAVPLLRTYVGDDGALIRAAIDQRVLMLALAGIPRTAAELAGYFQ
ncbi:MAG: asparaginase domain-containing protein [Lentisphaerae bacterium]|nr:asparaginase domain-containing protein [Lentisphaerota bacterium]